MDEPRSKPAETVLVTDDGSPGRARLISVAKGEYGRTYSVHDGVVVGRDPGVGIFVDAQDISRQHVRFTQGGNLWHIEDLGSSNGTQLNGVPLASIRPVPIRFGDRLQLGNSALFLFARYDAIEEKVLELQKIEAVGQLAAGVAHDFNNLLGAMQSNLEYVMTEVKCDTFDRDEVLACLDETTTAITRATEITRQLLGFSRRAEPHDSQVDLGALAAEVVQLCRRTFGAVSLRDSIHTNLTVTGVRPQLHQVLMNLCINARDAMPDGGTISLRVHREQLPTVTSLLVPSGLCAAITVADEGIGMDEQTRVRIFEPFFTTKGERGTGLGLATVYNIVRNHGGDIGVTSLPGHGTTFRIWLPLADVARADCPQQDQQRLPAATEPGAGPTGRVVLVVDDDPAVLSSTQRLLRARGFEVLCAGDGKEAVVSYEKNRGRIGCVVLDVVMPLLDGRDTLRILRTINPRVRVIMISGEVESADIRDLLGGENGFLPKPVDPELLVAMLGQILG